MDFLIEDQVEELILPDITDRADVNFWNPEAWQGLEQLRLSDFENYNKTLKKMQLHQLFEPFVNEMLPFFSQFASASKVEDQMSLVLKWHNAKLNFFDKLPFSDKVGGDEDCLLLMFLMSQAVHRYPDLLSALKNFRTQIEEIQKNVQNAQVNWDSVEVPQRFDGEALNVINTWGVEMMADLVIEEWMPSQTTDIFTAFRNRVVQEVQEYGIPNDLIRAASLQRNWQVELKKLRELEIRQAFVPVWQANGNVNKQQALQHFTLFLINPRFQTNENVVSTYKDVNGQYISLLKDVVVNAKDRQALLLYAHLGDIVKAKQNKAMLMDMFIHQALNLVAVDDGRFLAGLIHSIWMEKGDRLNKKSNLYKRCLSRGARSSWRQFIQEKLLNKSNDNEYVKEILKRLLEGVMDVSRDASKQHFTGAAVAKKLLSFFNEVQQM